MFKRKTLYTLSFVLNNGQTINVNGVTSYKIEHNMEGKVTRWEFKLHKKINSNIVSLDTNVIDAIVVNQYKCWFV